MCYNMLMDNKQYLESIAKDTRAAGTPKKGLFGLDLNIPPVAKKLLVGVGIALVLIIIVAMIVSILGGTGDKERDYVDKVYLRTSHLAKEIPAYNKQVKSSQLRSMGTSLVSVLNETEYSIANVLKNDFAAEKIDESENTKINESENNAMAELLTNLDNAQLNGLLDRVYHREITYQIGTLLSMEHEAYTSTKISGLKSALETSMNNLNQLYEQFQSFTSN